MTKIAEEGDKSHVILCLEKVTEDYTSPLIGLIMLGSLNVLDKQK